MTSLVLDCWMTGVGSVVMSSSESSSVLVVEVAVRLQFWEFRSETLKFSKSHHLLIFWEILRLCSYRHLDSWTQLDLTFLLLWWIEALSQLEINFNQLNNIRIIFLAIFFFEWFISNEIILSYLKTLQTNKNYLHK